MGLAACGSSDTSKNDAAAQVPAVDAAVGVDAMVRPPVDASADAAAIADAAPSIDADTTTQCDANATLASEACLLSAGCSPMNRYTSWDGKQDWCATLKVEEFQGWTLQVPSGTTSFDFWLDWGLWDHNACGDGTALVEIPQCGFSQALTRDGNEAHFTCDVTGLTTLTINKPYDSNCEYVLVGNPQFY